MQTLRTPYPSAKLARDAAGKFLDNIAKAVLTQTFVAHTATGLSAEEMEVTLCASYFDHIWSHSHLPGLSLCGSCCPAGLTLPRRAPIGETCQSLGRNFSVGNHAPHPVPSAGLAQSFFVMVAALADAN